MLKRKIKSTNSLKRRPPRGEQDTKKLQLHAGHASLASLIETPVIHASLGKHRLRDLL